MMRKDVARRLAALYDGRLLKEYVRWKIRTDPAYGAAFEALRHHEQPVVDLGCGLGLLPFFLREAGLAAPIVGIDFDERKVAVARRLAERYSAVTFVTGDARDPLPERHNVVMIDVLHYFDEESQRRILANAAHAVPPGGVVVIRQGLGDRSWRYRLTQIVDASARVIRWMRAERLSYPPRERIVAAFPGFEADIRPMRGRTPFNNYLLVFRKPGADRRSG